MRDIPCRQDYGIFDDDDGPSRLDARSSLDSWVRRDFRRERNALVRKKVVDARVLLRLEQRDNGHILHWDFGETKGDDPFDLATTFD